MSANHKNKNCTVIGCSICGSFVSIDQDEVRITKALTGAKDQIQDLRHKLDLAIECLEFYAQHVLADVYPWMADDAETVLKKIRR